MKTVTALCLAATLAWLPPSLAAAPRGDSGKDAAQFSFGVLAHVFRNGGNEATLENAISESDGDNLAFVVANGIKSADEPCSDALFNRRKELLDSAKNGLVVTIAGTDWVRCRTANGRSAAVERLNRLRELFHSNDMSLGNSRIPLQRQSVTPKFRMYGENARWEIGRVLFATFNLPAENNHYLPDAGRNSEFEDRLVANHDWLQRIFQSASRRKLAAVVLFSDGNPLALPASGSGQRRDGFAEFRKKLRELAERFPGKVLLIHGSGDPGQASPGIAWRNNLGVFHPGYEWSRIDVDPSSPALFRVSGDSSAAANARP